MGGCGAEDQGYDGWILDQGLGSTFQAALEDPQPCAALAVVRSGNHLQDTVVAGNGSGEALCAHFVPNKFLEGMPSEEKMKTLWFSSLEKRKLRGEPSLLTTAS